MQLLIEKLPPPLKSVVVELHQAVTDNPNTPFDQLSGPIIKKHHSPIAPAFSLGVFMWTIGVMNGRFIERQL